MQDAPDLPELLRVARATLAERVLPRVPAESARDVRMVASALAIAQRELSLQDGSRAAERARLAELFPAREGAALADLTRALAVEARHWPFGSQPQRELLIAAHLRACTIDKLRQNNPKALDDAPTTE